MTVAEDTLAGRLTPQGHELIQRVYYEDTDFSGRVYHARYLQFMERGRTDFLRLAGIGHAELFDAGLAFVVRHMDIDFLKAAAIDDVLRIVTGMTTLGGASMTLGQQVLRGSETVVSARVKAAVIDRQGMPVRLPPDLKAKLAARAGPGVG